MPPDQLRLVLDTNVVLAGMVSASSASQKIVDALSDRKAVPLLSASVMAEYRAVLLHRETRARFPVLAPRRVEIVLRRLRYIGDEFESGRLKFEFARDPLDAKFVELAIAGSATHLVTLDRDLLSLPTARTDAGKRFRQRLPRLVVQEPAAFVDENASLLGIP